MGRYIEVLQPAGLEASVRLDDAPRLAPALQAAMPGWSLGRWPTRAAQAWQLSAWEAGGRYFQRVPGRARPRWLPGLATAAASLIADLIPPLLDARPGLVGLHCAAVEVAGRLVLFPAPHRTGKSLLSAAFAAAGYRVFADDVLLLNAEDEGVALGIAPRLRLPLPEGLTPPLGRFIAEHDGVSDHRYRFLALARDRLAAHGETRPLGAIVMLDRVPGAQDARLTRLSPGEGLLQLLSQTLAGKDHDSARLLERLLPLMEGLPCRLLRYDDPMAAVERVIAGLDDVDEEAVCVSSAAASAAAMSGARAPRATWRRLPMVSEHALGDEHFLVDARGEVHRLSAVAAGIWRLLGLEPLTQDEIVALLAERFPEIASARLAADVAGLFDELAGHRLVTRLEN
ncbi:PqqD family protein [Halomonas getboli]|uniref:PqqD family protein n=1 Tax=Halomonas getboli TaxID=2935862 RepID=UPI001FFFB91F|nr:PqqD family protein [Halomonas getboli]MCK2182728.1 PqqD family protein [Halomonas getboli]